MAKNKYHYYVLVFTETGPVYVTSVDNSTKSVYWDRNETPMEFSQSYAEDLELGLNLNFHSAVLVKSRIVIENQPYRYSDFDCTFVEKKQEEN